MKKFWCVALVLVVCMLSQNSASWAAPVAKKKPVATKTTAVKPPVKKPVANKTAAVTPQMMQQYNRAVQLFKERRWVEAQRDMEQLLPKLSDTNPLLGNVLGILGQIEQNHMNYEKSKGLLERSIAVNEKAFGKNAVQLPSTLVSLAYHYFWNGDIQKAQQLSDRANQIQQTTHQTDPQVEHLRQILSNYIAAVGPTTPNYLDKVGDKIMHWRVDGNPILVYIQPGDSIPTWKPQDAELMKSAFQEWQEILGNRIQFAYTNDPNIYDIQVKWVDHPIGYKTEELHEMGQNLLKTRDDAIIQLDLQISLKTKEGFVVPDNHLRTIMLHEVGHMLGILGHSDSPSDIMFSVAHASHPSARDIATIRALYSTPPEVSNPPGIRLSQFKLFDEYFENASNAFRAQNYAAAYGLYNQALQIYPSHSYARFLMGFSAMQINRLDEAAYNCEAASMAPSKYQIDAYECTANSLYNSTIPALNSGQGANPEIQNRLAKAMHFYQLALQQPNLDNNRRNSIQQLLSTTQQQARQATQPRSQGSYNGSRPWALTPGTIWGAPTMGDPNSTVWGM